MARGPAQNSRELGNCPKTEVWWGLGGNGHVQTHPRDHTIHLGRGIPPHLDFGTISQAKPCFSDSWLWTPGSRRRRGPGRRWGRPAKSQRSKEHCNQIRQNPFRGKLCLGNNPGIGPQTNAEALDWPWTGPMPWGVAPWF